MARPVTDAWYAAKLVCSSAVSGLRKSARTVLSDELRRAGRVLRGLRAGEQRRQPRVVGDESRHVLGGGENLLGHAVAHEQRGGVVGEAELGVGIRPSCTPPQSPAISGKTSPIEFSSSCRVSLRKMGAPGCDSSHRWRMVPTLPRLSPPPSSPPAVVGVSRRLSAACEHANAVAATRSAAVARREQRHPLTSWMTLTFCPPMVITGTPIASLSVASTSMCMRLTSITRPGFHIAARSADQDER